MAIRIRPVRTLELLRGYGPDADAPDDPHGTTIDGAGKRGDSVGDAKADGAGLGIGPTEETAVWMGTAAA